ncbi:MAG: hypothetical protein KIT58_12240 [Planctomycetota bacterium]|nr:hypothetical protein [Planctomycetota bacterium]
MADVTTPVRGRLYQVESAVDFGRASFYAGPVEVPELIVLKVSANVRGEATPADLQRQGLHWLVQQGFDRPAGAFFELGLRAVEGHHFEGRTLTRTAWLSLNFGQQETLGLMRAVDHRRQDQLDLERPGPGFSVYPAAGGSARRPAFVVPRDHVKDELMVVWDLRRQGWSCSVFELPAGEPANGRSIQSFAGSWADMGTPGGGAPEGVWLWAHGGNWANGRGVGHLVGWTGVPPFVRHLLR